MRFGVQLPEVERVVRWPEYARMARTAEAVGFDSIWVGDHHLYRRDGSTTGPWEVWTSLAALAAVTERVRLAPFVASLTFTNPALLAKQAHTVDEISGGRLVLGVGAGWNEAEYRAFGFPWDRRVDRFEANFHVVRRLLAGETVSVDDGFNRLEDCVLLPPSARPDPVPIMVGSTGRRMLDIALPHAQGWNAWFLDYDNLPERVPALLDRLDAACDRVGRDPASLERSVAVLIDLGSSAPRAGSINPIRGSIEQMADAVGRIGEAGIDLVQLVLDPITEATIERAGELITRSGR